MCTVGKKKKVCLAKKRDVIQRLVGCACFNYLPTYGDGALIEWKENAERFFTLLTYSSQSEASIESIDL